MRYSHDAPPSSGDDLHELTKLLGQATEIDLATEAVIMARRRHAALQEAAQLYDALQQVLTYSMTYLHRDLLT